MAAKTEIVLFTGQSGVNVEQCLKRLRQRVSACRKAPVFKFERFMSEVYREEHPDEPCGEATAVWKFLILPPLLQRKLWLKSLKRVASEVERGTNGSLSFVSLHASFYHPKNREFLSPIDLMALGSLARKTSVRMVVVLVDDCYDIYRRLLQPGKIFRDDVMGEGVKPDAALVLSVWNLLTILSWREVEIAFSRKIAEVLGVPLYVLPVKHQAAMVGRLVCRQPQETSAYYLAHPITSVRMRTYARAAKFPDYLSGFAESCLRMRDDVVLFLPDTIDELRIRRQGDLYEPELEPGWPLPFDEGDWLADPAPADIPNPLNPAKAQVTRAKAKAISYSIGILAKKIEEQIVSRDLILVEQSGSGIIAYQPYWDGSVSSGALKEAEYNASLMAAGGRLTPRRTFVLETRENLGRYRILQLVDLVKNSYLKPEPDVAAKGRLEELARSWRDDATVIRAFAAGTFPVVRIRTAVELALAARPYEFDPAFLPVTSSSMPGTNAQVKGERLDAGWTKLHAEIMALDPFRSRCPDATHQYLFAEPTLFEQHPERLAQLVFGAKSKRQRRKS